HTAEAHPRKAHFERSPHRATQVGSFIGHDEDFGRDEWFRVEFRPRLANYFFGLAAAVHGGYIDDINAGRDGLLNRRYALFIGGRSPHHPYSTPAKGDGRNLKAGFPKRSLLHSNTSSRLDLFAAYSNNSIDY